MGKLFAARRDAMPPAHNWPGSTFRARPGREFVDSHVTERLRLCFGGTRRCILWAYLTSIALFLGLSFGAQSEAARALRSGPITADPRI